HHAFSSGAGRTSDGNGSHASTLKSPSYTKSVSWQHYRQRRMSELKISPELLQISPEVQDALKNKKPVVALESTIISHGMPFPQNAQTAIEVEETIRKQGAVPATIAIIGGVMKVGLSKEERSEERRVGKECRCRWGGENGREKKKRREVEIK